MNEMDSIVFLSLFVPHEVTGTLCVCIELRDKIILPFTANGTFSHLSQANIWGCAKISDLRGAFEC